MQPSKEDTIPMLSVQLVDELDKAYPHRCPVEGESSERMWMYAGARALIDNLLSRKDLMERCLMESD